MGLVWATCATVNNAKQLMILTHNQNVSHSQLSFFTYCSVILVGICMRRSNIYPLLRYFLRALAASYLSLAVLLEPTYWLVQEIVFDFWSSKGYSYEQWCIMYSFNEYQGPFLLQIIHQLIAFPILYDF